MTEFFQKVKNKSSYLTKMLYSLLSNGGFCKTSSKKTLRGFEDFQFNYLAISTPNDSRNPRYAANYNNGSAEFMSNYYMNLLLEANVPRLRYYFCRCC